VHITGQGQKRPFESFAKDAVPTSNRDGRAQTTEEGALKPAKSFAKYVDYNMSAMTDTKGGFLTADDDPHGTLGAEARAKAGPPQEEKPKHMTAAEWERMQLLKNLRRQKAGPFEPGLSVLDDEKARKKCRECDSLEIDWVWEDVFKCCICNACKEKFPEKYSLLTKTECREDYLLTDRESANPILQPRIRTNPSAAELKDAELLPHLSRPNPHKSHWHDMMLFLRYQVEDYAFKEKWGSSEALDAEFEKREADKKRRKEAKFKEKLLDLKKKTRTEAFRRQAAGGGRTGPMRFGDAVGGGKHVHEWGRTVETEEGMTVKKCIGCGMEVEELEL
jgi:DNA-repair protein complementing XP-A cells